MKDLKTGILHNIKHNFGCKIIYYCQTVYFDYNTRSLPSRPLTLSSQLNSKVSFAFLTLKHRSQNPLGMKITFWWFKPETIWSKFRGSLLKAVPFNFIWSKLDPTYSVSALHKLEGKLVTQCIACTSRHAQMHARILASA